MKFTLKLLSIIFLFLTTPFYLFPCSCAPSDASFCAAVSGARYIVEVVVIDKPENHNLELNVLDEINLSSQEDTLLILGQDGWNCGEFLGDFNIGDTMIFALYQGVFYDADNNELHNYYLDGCHLNYLRIENNLVVGKIRDNLMSETRENFKNNIVECMNIPLTVSENNVEISNLTLYPNPVSDKLFIDHLDFNFQTVEVFNTKGERVIAQNLNQNEIVLREVPPGIYFIKISSEEKSVIKRIVKK